LIQVSDPNLKELLESLIIDYYRKKTIK
jgi:hypothetical protein